MKLTDNVIVIIGDNTDQQAKRIRTKLALALKCTERWIQDCIKENKDNGALTKYAAVDILREETGLSDNEILDMSEVEATRA